MAVVKTITIKGDTTDAVKAFKDLGDVIQEQKDITIEFEKELSKLERQLKDTPKANLRAQKALKKRIVGLKEAVKDQRLSIKELNNERVKSNKILKKTNTNLKENRGAFNLLNKATGGLATRFKDGVNAIKSFNISLGVTRVAIIATGIGALLILITSLTQAFKKSEAGQNRFAKIMGVIGSVVGNVTDLFADLGTFILDLFSGDSGAVKALTSFGKKIFDVVGLPIKNLIDTVKTLGRVLGALFSGDIDGAFEALNQGVTDIKDNFLEAGAAIVSAKNALSDFADEIADDAEKAGIVADKRAKADIIDRNLLIEKAIATRKINELRLQAEDREANSATKRIALLKEASAIEEGITNKRIAANKLRLDAQELENTLDLNNKDNLNAIAKLTVKGIDLDSQKLRLQRLLQTQITTALNDEKAGIKSVSEAKQKALDDAAKAAQDAADKILDFEEKQVEALRDLDAETREQKLALEQERAQEDLDNLIGTETEKQEAQDALNRLFFEQDEALKAEQRLTAKAASDAFFAGEADARKREGEVAANDKKILREQEFAALVSTLSIANNLLAGAAKKNKGFAIAQALINTFLGISAGVKLGYPAAIPAVIAAAAVGFKAVSDIAKTKDTETGSGSATVAGNAFTPQAPSFNLVEGSGTNQIAEGLAGQDTPIKAFVVSSDVTTSQSLDRNIVEDSTF